MISQRPPADGAPPVPVDVDSIPELVPQPVVRSLAGNISPYTVLGSTYSVLPESDGFVEEGLASWYGSKFHGRLTSNGERFDMYALSAAHKHLPIPTYVEVTNLNNGRSIILRVNDRGPFYGDRVLDLSWAAAAKLGFAEQGTAPVRIVALDPQVPAPASIGSSDTVARVSVENTGQTPSASAPLGEPLGQSDESGQKSYYQVALLSHAEVARRFANEVEVYTKFPVRVKEVIRDSNSSYRVLIGPLIDRSEAAAISMVLEFAGLVPGFMVELRD